MWHVSSRSGVETLRTAIHLLLTYLLTYVSACVLTVDAQAGGVSAGRRTTPGGRCVVAQSAGT